MLVGWGVPAGSIRFTVSALVVGEYVQAVSVEHPGYMVVAPAVFADAVHDNHHGFGWFFCHPCPGEQGESVFGYELRFLQCHDASMSNLISLMLRFFDYSTQRWKTVTRSAKSVNL